MARTALVRSASLARDEVELVDALAERLADGSFTGLLRQMLVVFGEPLRRRLDEMAAAGLDPDERLVLLRPTEPATRAQIEAFYRASDWPAEGPRDPPTY